MGASNILILTLIISNSLLKTKPPPTANYVYVQYQLSNVPKAEDEDCSWIPMKNSSLYENENFHDHHKKIPKNQFLHTRYWIIPNLHCVDTEWHLYLLNQDKLYDYYVT